MNRLARTASMACAAAAAGYGAYVAFAWARYGHPLAPHWWDRDELLDRFMPRYDIVERHHVLVDAPPDVVLAAAREQRLFELPVVREIFKTREWLLGAAPVADKGPKGLLAQTTAMGWRVLADVPGREVVVGVATRPWEANVTFRGIPPDEFATFNEPNYVKIIWNLRAHRAGPGRAIFRTETRAVATDAAAVARFRPYWAFLSPGIIAIRWLAAAQLKAQFTQCRRQRASASIFESAIRSR